MESTFRARLADSELIVPMREKIQCYTCVYADRKPIVTKNGYVVAEDRIDYDDCEMFDEKPLHVLFPDKNDNYHNCPKYKKMK